MKTEAHIPTTASPRPAVISADLSFSLPSDFCIEYSIFRGVVFLWSSVSLKLGLYVSIHFDFHSEASPQEERRDFLLCFAVILVIHCYSLTCDNLKHVLDQKLSFLGLRCDEYDWQNNGPKDVHSLSPEYVG